MRSLMVRATLLAFTMGCGGDSGGGGVEPPADANVAGAWIAAWTNMNSGLVSCTVRDVRLQLNQTGRTFTGSTNGGEFRCGGQPFQPFRTFQVVNGTVDESQVTFDLNDQSFHNRGSVSGSSMSGTAAWTASIDGQSFTLNGTWSAAR